MMKYFSLCFLLLLSVSECRAETLTLATFPIPLMVESKNEGIFIELAQALAQEVELELNIIVLPPLRTLQEFAADKVDGIFPGLSVNMPGNYERSDSVYVKRDYAFTTKGKPLLVTIDDLLGKYVGITAGYPYVKALTDRDGIYLEYANSDEQNVKKLLAGRIDVFVVEEKSGLKAFENNGSSDNLLYNPERPLSEQDVFFAFQNNDRGKYLVNIINEALSRLKNDGTLDNIMSKAQ